MRRLLIIVGIVLLPLIPIVLVVTGVLKQKPTSAAPVSLAVWGTEDEETALAPLIADYRKTHPHVTIVYSKVRPEDYFQALVSGWAQGSGPDIFFTPNTWIGQMSQYAVPLPANISVKQLREKIGFLASGKEVVTVPQAGPSAQSIRQNFVDVVGSDVIRDDQVWGLPLSMDTLVTYYNKDLLNDAKIFDPAKSWTELVNQITGNKLTVTDQQGNLVKSGVALGTATNVPYATDLLTLLMMQNGSTMVGADKKVQFQGEPGLNALNFYTSFADNKKGTYSWNTNQPNGREAFIQGKVAYFFGSLADRAAIAASNLNWSVGPMLHIRPEGDNDGFTKTQRLIDVARYQVAMVAKASALSGKSVYAWNFVTYMTGDVGGQIYAQSSGHLVARKAILSKQKDNPDLSVYAGQLLTARSWYRGNGGANIDGYLQSLITTVNQRTTDPAEALDLAAKQVESTL